MQVRKNLLASIVEKWSVVPSSVKPPHSGCMGVLQKASWEMGGPDTWAINSERPLIPCFHCWCSTELCIQALPVFIGCGDCYWRGWQLSARLSERPSCALHCCSASQHYCSWWAFFLKSFPAVSWYGRPLKLAPDCSVYFVLDKQQNTVPAASQEVGGSGGGDQRTQARSFTKGRVPRQNREKAHMWYSHWSCQLHVTLMGWPSKDFGCAHTSFQKRKLRPQHEVILERS